MMKSSQIIIIVSKRLSFLYSIMVKSESRWVFVLNNTRGELCALKCDVDSSGFAPYLKTHIEVHEKRDGRSTRSTRAKKQQQSFCLITTSYLLLLFLCLLCLRRLRRLRVRQSAKENPFPSTKSESARGTETKRNRATHETNQGGWGKKRHPDAFPRSLQASLTV